MPIDRLVIVAGAGASHELGRGGTPLPLMQDWNNVLRRSLDVRECGLAALVGVNENQTGPEFETAVGHFLSWHDSFERTLRFLRFGLSADASSSDFPGQWQQRARSR